MEIVDIETIQFTYESTIVLDEFGHSHPSGPHESTKTLTKIVVDDGPDGHYFGGSKRGNNFALERIKGENPLEREVIWRRLNRSQRLGIPTISNADLAAIDCALWDVAGRHFEQPIYRLLGGRGGEIPAIAYTMVGDDDPDGLGSPAAFATFATDLVDEGYTAINLHSWMPPYGADSQRDIAVCSAVREAVGDTVELMFDSYHHYDRAEALKIGRHLEELAFGWFEEPMNEYSLSSYQWLSEALDIPIIGPKSADGKVQTRAEWLKRGISDMVRVNIKKMGGLTPAIKTGALCEAFGARCEIHDRGAASLHLLGSTVFPGTYYQRGTLHPNFDYDRSQPWLHEQIDPLTTRGTVPVPDRSGLGQAIDWEFIAENRCE